MLAHRLEAERDLGLGVVVDGAGDADFSGLGEPLETRGDVDPIAVDVALLDDHVADVDADAERDAPVLGQLRLALGDALLDRGGALDRIDHARELDQRAVAHELGDRGRDARRSWAR